jgi:hypothetical protein
VVNMVTIQQQTRVVMIAAAAVCAVYFPTASVVGSSYAPHPVPLGAVRQIFGFERLSADGFGYLARQPNFRVRPEVVIYENDEPLPGSNTATVHDIDGVGLGRYSQENGKGFMISASDNSDPRANGRDYWIVTPPQDSAVESSQVAGPAPPGAVQLFIRFERVSTDGFGYFIRVRDFHNRPEIVVYEDDKPLGSGDSSLQDIDRIGRGRNSQEGGKGFFISASDNSDPRTNRKHYWAVIPPQRR